MLCPHCHREQKDNAQKVCIFCKKNLSLPHPADDGVIDSEAVTKFKTAKAKASGGDALEQYRLGLLYYQGSGCERNLNQAVRFFEIAARSGLAAAEYALALCLLQGEGIEKDARRALGLLAQASRHGHNGARKLLQEIGQTYRNKTRTQVELITPDDAESLKNKVGSVYFLPDDNANTCPQDQYELYKQMAFLACHSFAPLEVKGYLRLPLLRCSHCRNWYVSNSILNKVKADGFNPGEIDIINSPEYPRVPELEKLYKIESSAAKSPARGRRKTIRSRKTAARRRSDLHLAIRCQYCDGGKTGKTFGFKGICTPENYRLHKKYSSTSWCASKDNECQEWSVEQLENQQYPCSECHFLLDWACSESRAGAEKKAARKIAGNRAGHIAVMTTVLPGEEEKKRRLFAIFTICEPENQMPGELCADPRMRLELTLEEKVFFWDHYKGSGQSDRPIWGSPFYRNLADEQIRSMLTAAQEQVKDQERQEIIGEMLATLPDSDSVAVTASASPADG